jgi:hypothetical protein
VVDELGSDDLFFDAEEAFEVLQNVKFKCFAIT